MTVKRELKSQQWKAALHTNYLHCIAIRIILTMMVGIPVCDDALLSMRYDLR